MPMTTHRPYLVRALNEWILDNNCTPYILVNAYEKGVEVPQNYVKDGQIVLNISPVAVQGLVITNAGIEFNGRFGGIPTHVYVPTSAVLGIYAKENGQGMIFDREDMPEPPPEPVPGPTLTVAGDNTEESGKPSKSKRSSKPSLRVVK
jgi:stringent starvation protein B